ncbi:pYEATS domain-containing protein [Sulfurimonas sp.]|uniref:pYEATS domain-containing protein n=1 Tax=Sulfurimonas sp. TaxID=2022749 RepID=UPI003D0FB76E
MNTLETFGNTAKDLARNPLGIIALFIVLIYGFAALLIGSSEHLVTTERMPIIWFLTIFPVIVLSVFAWLVSSHHKKLYAPSDFKDEKIFAGIENPQLSKFVLAKQKYPDTQDLGISEQRAVEREKIYEDCRGYFLAHIVEPSNKDGQEFDIFIYIIRHKSTHFTDIDKAKFFFGSYWGNKIYEGTKTEDYIGVRTSAYGPFLCTCKISFKNNESITISRYIDFEMGNFVKKLTSQWSQ